MADPRTPARAKRAAPKSVQAAKRPAKPRRIVPEVRLGVIAPNGISASMYGLIERGCSKRPRVAQGLRGRVEIHFAENFAPVSVVFAAKEIVVEDVIEPDPPEGEKPKRRRKGSGADLVIQGSLPDIVQLASAPLVGGLPKPTQARGRAALKRVANGRVKIEGNPLLARRVLKLLEI